MPSDTPLPGVSRVGPAGLDAPQGGVSGEGTRDSDTPRVGVADTPQVGVTKVFRSSTDDQQQHVPPSAKRSSGESPRWQLNSESTHRNQPTDGKPMRYFGNSATWWTHGEQQRDGQEDAVARVARTLGSLGAGSVSSAELYKIVSRTPTAASTAANESGGRSRVPGVLPCGRGYMVTIRTTAPQ